MSLSFTYQCNDQIDCKPYEITFYPGLYQIELWGAQGGNISEHTEGGRGGYAKGIMQIQNTQKMYIFLGGHGFAGTSVGFTQNAFNGGGKGAHESNQFSATSGGGGTDLRTNLSLDSIILVAGGGGGAARWNTFFNNGGCGGGTTGSDGIDTIFQDNNYKGGGGGKDNVGGSSDAQKGDFGFGGNQTIYKKFGSGGGGGWHGGGSGISNGASGGGGSGYASTLFIRSQLLSGCSEIPNFYNEDEKVAGHYGSGCARITLITNCSVKIKTEFHILIHFILIVIFSK